MLVSSATQVIIVSHCIAHLGTTGSHNELSLRKTRSNWCRSRGNR